MRNLLRWLRVALATLALAHAVLFAVILGRRLFYPYDLEWMEGGMLLHALRIRQGEPIYGPPSLAFVPYVYPPLYPALLALVSKGGGLGYLLGRAVSVAALGVALGLGYRTGRRAGSDRVTAAAAMIAVVAAFPFVGAWYDLVRVDSLFLALGMAGLYCLVRWPSAKGALAGAALLSASYLTKQTAAGLLLLGLGMIVLLAWRAAWIYALAVAAVCGGAIAWLQSSSHGWFWTWCVRVPSHHAFYARRAFLETPWTLFSQAPALWLAIVAITAMLLARRRMQRVQWVWLGAALGGVLLACIGFGKQWAFTNAYIPGVFFPLVLVALFSGAGPLPRAMVGVALGVQLASHFYDPRPYLPTAADRAAGDRLLGRIRSVGGTVLIPYHPYYPVMVGKPALLHRMGLLDALGAGLGRPAGLDDALAAEKFDLVILDDRVRWEEWPTLPGHYLLEEQLVKDRDAPRAFSGAPTSPRYVFVPRGVGN